MIGKFLLSFFLEQELKTDKDATGSQSQWERLVFSLELVTVTLAQVSFCDVSLPPKLKHNQKSICTIESSLFQTFSSPRGQVVGPNAQQCASRQLGVPTASCCWGPGLEKNPSECENSRTQTLPFNPLWTGADRSENESQRLNLTCLSFVYNPAREGEDRCGSQCLLSIISSRPPQYRELISVEIKCSLHLSDVWGTNSPLCIPGKTSYFPHVWGSPGAALIAHCA